MKENKHKQLFEKFSFKKELRNGNINYANVVSREFLRNTRKITACWFGDRKIHQVQKY